DEYSLIGCRLYGHFKASPASRAGPDHRDSEPSIKTIIRDPEYLRHAWLVSFPGVLPERSLSLFGFEPLNTMTYGAFCFLIGGFFFGRNRVAPDRLVFAIAPCAWAIEGMHAEPVNFLHLMDPIRGNPVGVIVRRFLYLRPPQFPVEDIARDALGAFPCGRFRNDVWNTVAGEGELAGQMTVRVLVHDAADVIWVEWRKHPIHDHLCHRDLPAHGLTACFEVNGIGETFFSLRPRGSGKRQPL